MNLSLSLQRPFAVFDLETTGVNVTRDRIVEIAIIKLMPDGTEHEYYRRVNPQMPIPQESTAIHGITDEHVKDEPFFSAIADEVAAFIGDADLADYNSNKFDIPVLAEEFLRCNHGFDIRSRKFVDVQNIFHKMEQRTLAAAYQFYCQQTMQNAHNALYDTRVTLDVFKAQLERYETLSRSVHELAEFTRQGNIEWHDFAGRLAVNENGKIMYNFGKHKGKTVEEIHYSEPGYYGWMLDADFPLYTKQLLKEEIERIKAERKQSQPAQNQNDRQPMSMEDKLAALKNKFNK